MRGILSVIPVLMWSENLKRAAFMQGDFTAASFTALTTTDEPAAV